MTTRPRRADDDDDDTVSGRITSWKFITEPFRKHLSDVTCAWKRGPREPVCWILCFWCAYRTQSFSTCTYVCTKEPTKVDGWQSAERKGHGPYSPVWCKHTVAKHVWSVINFNNITLPWILNFTPRCKNHWIIQWPLLIPLDGFSR